MKTTVLTAFVGFAIVACGLVCGVHWALSGLDHIEITAAGR